MFKVSQAVQERAEALVRVANLPIESLRFESVWGRGLRVIGSRASNSNVLCGLILTFVNDDGEWDLIENEPPRPEKGKTAGRRAR